MTVKLSRDPGTPKKYPSWHSFVERIRDPGTKTTVIIFIVTMNNKTRVKQSHTEDTVCACDIGFRKLHWCALIGIGAVNGTNMVYMVCILKCLQLIYQNAFSCTV